MSSLYQEIAACKACEAHITEGVAPCCDKHKMVFALDQELDRKFEQAKKLADQLGADTTYEASREENYVI